MDLHERFIRKGMMQMDLHWNVYCSDFNSRKIEVYDIFNHYRLSDAVEKLRKKKPTKEKLAEVLKKELMYNFWSKSEHEVVLTTWPPYISKQEYDKVGKEFADIKEKYGRDPIRTSMTPETAVKIDVYDQVMLNYDRFVDYVFEEMNKRRRKNATANNE